MPRGMAGGGGGGSGRGGGTSVSRWLWRCRRRRRGANTSFQGNLTVGPTVPVQTKPFDPEPRRESMRAALAMVLVAALLVLIGFLVVGVALSWLDIATAKDLATLALTPLAGLTGTVVGFYYAGGKG